MDSNLLTNNNGDGSAPRQVAIVGLNRETAWLLPSLLDVEGLQVIKILNPDIEDLSRLTQYPHLSVIIDTTNNAAIAGRLRRLPLKKVDVISSMSARILFCSIRGAASPKEGAKDHVLRCMEEVREAVSLSRNKDEILRVILNTAVKMAGADTGSLMLLDATRKQLTIEAAIGLSDQVVLSTAQRVGNGISGSAIRKGGPLIIQGKADGGDYERPDLVSSICCPLMYGDEAVGVINIASRNPGRVFSAEDAAFIEDLARLTAEIIKTVKDNDTNQHSEKALALFNSVRDILAMKYRFEERLNLLLMKMANTFGANLCNYYEYSPEDGLFVAKASSAIGVNLLKEKPKFLDEFFAQRVLKTDNTFCVNAAGKTPRGKKWYLLQPIRCDQELVGTLFVQLHSEKNAVKEEAVLLRRIGELLAREVGRSREMEAIKAQSLKYSAVSQFSSDIANASSLPELGRMILSNVRLILEAETCVLRLRNAPDEELRVFDTLSHKNPAWLKDILALDELVIGDVGPGRSVALFPDLRESPYNLELLGSESAVLVALEIEGKVLGTISLYDKKSLDLSGSRSFGEPDREMLLNFGLQAAKGLKRFYPFPAPASWKPVPVPVE